VAAVAGARPANDDRADYGGQLFLAAVLGGPANRQTVSLHHLFLDHMLGGGRVESIQNNKDQKNIEWFHQFQMYH